jgi:dihydroflavonol-4-reductase
MIGHTLVTGASGFVGSAVARALLAEGYSVRVLVRPSSPRTNLDDLAVEIVEGDVRDADAVDRAMHDIRYVVHTAADYRLWAPRPAEIVRTNVDGTRIVMVSALRAGVERIVHTSSVATLAIPSTGQPANETTPLGEADAVGTYKRSKVAAERLVEAMIANDGLPAVIVNPSTPIGPRDIRPTPTGQVIIEAARGRIPAYVDTGLNLVHVDDVAAGHVAALAHGKIGERYILGGQNVALSDMLGDIARIVGRSPPRVKLPRELIYPAAIAAEAIASLTQRPPFITRDGLRMSRSRMFFSSAKAERDLGYRAGPYLEAIRAAIAWFREAGYLR